MGRLGFVDWLTLDDYRQVCSVNLFGLIDVTMTFLPLIKKEKGRIVNMSKSIILLLFMYIYFRYVSYNTYPKTFI